MACGDGLYQIEAVSELSRVWLEKRLLNTITGAIQTVTGQTVGVSFIGKKELLRGGTSYDHFR